MLTPVDDKQQIQALLDVFNKDYQQDEQSRDLARDLLRHTTYWVYSPNSRNFAPSKFVGFQKMDFRAYEVARKTGGKQFDGGRTRKAIEKALRTSYTENPQLSDKLKDW